MNKLLAANFSRLIRSKAFWGGMVFMLVIGVGMPIMHYNSMRKEGYPMYIDNGFFISALLIGILLSILCSMFVGTEYSDGTIRNKVVVGQKRPVIYLSNLITCAVAGILMCAVCLIVYLCVGIPLLGFFRTEINLILIFVLCLFGLTIAFSSIFTFIAMLNQNKAVVAVICILSAFLLLLGSSYIIAQLNEPEMYESYMYLDESGEIVTDEAQPNPNFVGGTKRKVYEFLTDILPGGQAQQISNMAAEQPWLLLLYSGVVTVGTAGAGLLLFQRKDLK